MLMKWNRSALEFAWNALWRFGIIVLPWQTRWLWGGAILEGGYKPEESFFSFYISWFVLLAAAVVAALLKAPGWRKVKPPFWFGIGLIALASCFSTTSYSWQWWTQIFVLIFFVASVIRMRVSRTELLALFALAVMPHALLGIWQYATQHVVGASWLGIAAQLPATPGVSVVFMEGERILRAYGGFPHPNIFGAWLAVGLFAAFRLIRRPVKNWHAVLGWLSLALFPAALILSFSRTALLMALAVIGTELFHEVKRKRFSMRIMRGIGLVGVISLVIMALVWPVFSARAPLSNISDAMGSASVTERIALIPAAFHAFKMRPFTGYGPGSSVFIMKEEGAGAMAPHNLLPIILLETGLLGLTGAVILLAAGFRTGKERFIRLGLILLPALMFDHYFWSYWSGQALLGVGVLLYFTTLDDSSNSARLIERL